MSVGIPSNPNPDVVTVPTPPAAPLDAPALRVEHAAPLAPAPAPDLTLAQRVAGLENKAFYDGEYIAKLRAELTIAGQCIDALTVRVGALADQSLELNQRIENLVSGAGNSQPVADNPPGE